MLPNWKKLPSEHIKNWIIFQGTEIDLTSARRVKNKKT
jgi:hypothetical protein